MSSKYGKAKSEFLQNRVSEIRANGGTDATRIANKEWKTSEARINAMLGTDNGVKTVYESNYIDNEDAGSPDF